MPRGAPGPVQPPDANRTDLAVPPTPGIQSGGQPNGIPQQVQPIQTPTGLPYGENQQLTQDQQQAPLPQAPSAPVGGADQGPPAPDFQAALSAAKGFTVPPNVTMMRPSDRPNEHVTAGIPGSAAGGPGPQARQVGSLSSMISAVAAASGSAALSQLASRAAAAGQ